MEFCFKNTWITFQSPKKLSSNWSFVILLISGHPYAISCIKRIHGFEDKQAYRNKIIRLQSRAYRIWQTRINNFEMYLRYKFTSIHAIYFYRRIFNPSNAHFLLLSTGMRYIISRRHLFITVHTHNYALRLSFILMLFISRWYWLFERMQSTSESNVVLVWSVTGDFRKWPRG